MKLNPYIQDSVAAARAEPPRLMPFPWVRRGEFLRAIDFYQEEIIKSWIRISSITIFFVRDNQILFRISEEAGGLEYVCAKYRFAEKAEREILDMLTVIDERQEKDEGAVAVKDPVLSSYEVAPTDAELALINGNAETQKPAPPRTIEITPPRASAAERFLDVINKKRD